MADQFGGPLPLGDAASTLTADEMQRRLQETAAMQAQAMPQADPAGLGDVTTTAANVGSEVLDAATDEGIGALIGGAAEMVGGAARGLIEGAGSVLGAAGEAIGSATGGLLENAPNLLEGAGSILGAAGEVAGGLLEGAGEAVGDIVGGILDGIGNL